MSFERWRRILPCLALLACWMGWAVPTLAQTSGIFADFTTSLGNFSCQLDYTNAPKAVANFIGLASGQHAWLDLRTGQARTNAFYNGLAFHRVIAGFMIQGGSPNGMGTDGPGYAFVDEFSPLLRFESPGVLAMANSGPDSNGAQFFITVASTAWLNDVHTIFGRVVTGQEVVNAISQVSTDANSKPLANVVIQQVSIRRTGAAAQAFDQNAQSLPVVTNLPLKIGKAPGQVVLEYTSRMYAHNYLYASTNLTHWTAESLGIELAAPLSNRLQKTMDVPGRFYRVAQVQYGSSTFAPKNVYGRKLTLNLSNGGTGSIAITFDATGGGTYTFPPNAPGSVNGYYWTQEPYRSWLLVGLSGLPVLNVRLDFSASASGTFTGTAYPYYPSSLNSFPVGGSFGLGTP